jgi:hypothetical protein
MLCQSVRSSGRENKIFAVKLFLYDAKDKNYSKQENNH